VVTLYRGTLLPFSGLITDFNTFIHTDWMIGQELSIWLYEEPAEYP